MAPIYPPTTAIGAKTPLAVTIVYRPVTTNAEPRPQPNLSDVSALFLADLRQFDKSSSKIN
jgi:hypothetical protein